MSKTKLRIFLNSVSIILLEYLIQFRVLCIRKFLVKLRQSHKKLKHNKRHWPLLWGQVIVTKYRCVTSKKFGLKLTIQKTKIMTSGPITSWQIDGDTVTHYILGSRIPEDGDCSREIKRLLLLWKTFDQPRQHIKKQRHYFTNKGPSSQGYGFPSGHVWMWELNCKESWASENWCFWTVVLEKTWESLGQQGDPTSPS